MVVLSNEKIIAEREAGNIVITPFNQSQVNTSSYDVRLANRFYRNNSEINILNPWQGSQEYWKEDRATKVESAEFGLEPGQEYILLNPGETILGYTQEKIGGLKNITTMMKTRSSLRRSNITCCECAGWGDIGFVNHWCMEIKNQSLHSKIILPVGKRVAQIIFLYTSESKRDYRDEGKYDSRSEEWSLENILPKLNLDEI